MSPEHPIISNKIQTEPRTTNAKRRRTQMNKDIKCQQLMYNQGLNCITQAISWDRTSYMYQERPRYEADPYKTAKTHLGLSFLSDSQHRITAGTGRRQPALLPGQGPTVTCPVSHLSHRCCPCPLTAQ